MLSGPNESVETLLQAQPRRTGQTGTLLMQAQTETRQVKQQGATVARMVSQNQNEQGTSRLGREISTLRTKQEDLAETLEQLLPMLCPVGQMCFPAGTLVDTKHGKRPIETIEKGEGVWARDPITGEWRLAKVDETFRREYNGRIMSVVAGGETIRVTERHPFRVVPGNDLDKRPIIHELGADNLDVGDGGRWVEAQHLQKGDVLVSRERSTVEVEEVSATEQSITVYNLRVAECRSYTVGASGVLVHNVSPPPSPCPSQLQFMPTTEEVTVSYLPDPVDRVTEVQAVIVTSGHPRTNFATGFPTWWAAFRIHNSIGGLGWRKGHLVGSQFGGQASADNLAPQTFRVNNSAIQTCDNRIREALACGCVRFNITVNYDADKDPLRPDSFRIQANNGHGYNLDVTIYNTVNASAPMECEP